MLPTSKTRATHNPCVSPLLRIAVINNFDKAIRPLLSLLQQTFSAKSPEEIQTLATHFTSKPILEINIDELDVTKLMAYEAILQDKFPLAKKLLTSSLGVTNEHLKILQKILPAEDMLGFDLQQLEADDLTPFQEMFTAIYRTDINRLPISQKLYYPRTDLSCIQKLILAKNAGEESNITPLTQDKEATLSRLTGPRSTTHPRTDIAEQRRRRRSTPQQKPSRDTTIHYKP
jgi:hypothetical protein